MKKRLTTYFLLILMFGSGVQAQEFESATVAVKNMGVGCSFTTGTVPVVIMGARDIIAHHYFEVDADEVFSIIKNDLAPLKEAILFFKDELFKDNSQEGTNK